MGGGAAQISISVASVCISTCTGVHICEPMQLCVSVTRRRVLLLLPQNPQLPQFPDSASHSLHRGPHCVFHPTLGMCEQRGTSPWITLAHRLMGLCTRGNPHKGVQPFQGPCVYRWKCTLVSAGQKTCACFKTPHSCSAPKCATPSSACCLGESHQRRIGTQRWEPHP